MKLEDRIDLGDETMFWKKKNQTDTQNVDESRRDFIKNAPLGALGAYAAMRGFTGEEAHASNSNYPPGIADDFYSNEALRWAWMNHVAWRDREMRENTFHRAVLAGLGKSEYGRVPYVLKPEEWHTKPAAHLVAAFSGTGKGGRHGDFQSPIREWNDMIQTFAHRYILYDYRGRRKVYDSDLINKLEKPGIIGLAKAAGLNDSENVWKEYHAGDQNTKTRIAQTIISNLENKDKLTRAIAHWTSSWLATHLLIAYQNNLNNTTREEAELINQLIERPLRKNLPRIRGPPNYGYKKSF